MEFILNHNGTKNRYGFHLNPRYRITTPKVKTLSVDIPFGHGELDLTESLTNQVLYGNRKITFTLEKLRPKSSWDDAYELFVKELHGKRVTVFKPRESDYYFVGRVQVGEMRRGDYMSFVVEIDCEPFRYKNNLTTFSTEVTTTQTTIIPEIEEEPVVPVIVTTGAVEIGYKGNIFSVNAGTHNLPIILDGNTSITVKGSGSITLRWRERKI